LSQQYPSAEPEGEWEERSLLPKGPVRYVLSAGVILIIIGVIWLLEGGNNPFSSAAKSSSISVGGTGAIPKIGDKAIDFTLEDLSGKKVKLSDFRGKVVLINFWASWCPPCREEMPALQAVYQDKQSENLVVLAVDIQEDSDTVSRFVQKLGLTFPIAMDTEGEVTEAYGIDSIPSSFFVDKSGTIRAISIGAMTKETILKNLAKAS